MWFEFCDTLQGDGQTQPTKTNTDSRRCKVVTHRYSRKGYCKSYASRSETHKHTLLKTQTHRLPALTQTTHKQADICAGQFTNAKHTRYT